MNMDKRPENSIYNAFKISAACICIYMMSYCIRNLLTVSTAEIIKEGIMTKEKLGFLSAVYYGAASCLFPFVSNYAVQLLCFGVMGFGLSMLRGSLVKIILLRLIFYPAKRLIFFCI